MVTWEEQNAVRAAAITARITKDRYRSFRDCSSCKLYLRCQSPFMQGRGPKGKPELLVVGEAPGSEEDAQDEPFVGASGALLTRQFGTIGLDPEQVWFTNVVCCRPPDNKIDKCKRSIDFCKGAVWQEIQEKDPDIVLLLGNTALGLLGLSKISIHHGRVYTTADVLRMGGAKFHFPDQRERIYVAMYHPAAILRARKGLLKQAREGMLRLRSVLSGEYFAERKTPPTRIIGALLRSDKCEGKEYVEWEPWTHSPEVFKRKRDHQFKRALAYLRAAQCRPMMNIDYETTGLDPYQVDAKILCVGLAPCKVGKDENGVTQLLPPTSGVSIPLDHADAPWTRKQLEEIKEALRQLLRRRGVRFLAHNAKFEYLWTYLHLGVEISEDVLIEDTMLKHYSIDETPGTHKLKELVFRFTSYGGYEADKDRLLEEVEGDWKRMPMIGLCRYNAMDAWVMAPLWNYLETQVVEEQQREVLQRILYPTTQFLGYMELTGINPNLEAVNELDLKYEMRSKRLAKLMMSESSIQEAESVIFNRRGEKADLMKREEKLDEESGKRRKLLLQKKEYKIVEEDKANLRGWKKLLKEIDLQEARVDRAAKSYEYLVNKLRKEATFNFRHDHLEILFYDVLGLKELPNHKTKGGGRSTDGEVMEHYKHLKIMQMLLEWTKLSKLRSTYLIPIKSGLVVKPDKLIHPNVIPLTRTGRMSSGQKERGKEGESATEFKFNIQNLERNPKYHIRRAFQTRYVCPKHVPTAESDCPDCGRIVAGDYAQLEFMLLGIFSKDKKVLDCIATQTLVRQMAGQLAEMKKQGVSEERIAAFAEDLRLKTARSDIHRISASAAFEVNPEDVTDEQRDFIKSAVSFGVAYGRGARALAEDMGWSFRRAARFIANFFAGYYNIEKYLEDRLAFARKHGYVLSKFGRKRRLPEIDSVDGKARSHAENQAVNFDIQGTASDFNLLSAMKLNRLFRKKEMQSRVIALVHDAIYVDSPTEEVEVAKIMMTAVMEAVPLTFDFMEGYPLRAEVKAFVTMEAEKKK